MGKVAITFKLMPEDIDVDIEAIKSQVEELGAKQIIIEEIAFGLKAIKAMFIMEDKGGGQNLEERLGAIEGVGSVETEGITLI